jgi:hypothetical protein
MSYVSFSTKETAQMIRAALKKNFPGTKFSVRTSYFAGGSAVDIGWTDGPTTKAVDAVVGPYQGDGFDGMIDMSYSKQAIMLADGTVTYGPCEGTGGQKGSVPEYKPEIPEGAKVVSFGAKFVQTHRKKSPAAIKAGLEAVVAKYGNWVGLPEDLGQAVKVSDWDGSGSIDRTFADKQVTGEPGWNLHWSLESQVWQALGEMSFPA